jgi:AcrR family transcriptional regulator
VRVPDRNAAATRARILEIAGELFRTQSYAGTSIADIAGRLGTSKAALYYHFPSKEDILDAILAESLAAHARIAELADGRAAAEDLLGALIDLVTGAGTVLTVFGNDPSVVAALSAREADYRLRDKDSRIVAALAGPKPSVAARTRAIAAIAVAKDGTREVLTGRDRGLSKAERAELLAAALRVLELEGPR